jgi:hopene-associated glycosyltransferase HpnB
MAMGVDDHLRGSLAWLDTKSPENRNLHESFPPAKYVTRRLRYTPPQEFPNLGVDYPAVTILAQIATGIGLLSMAAWVYMAFYRGGFWKTDCRLPEHPRLQGRWPRVAVIVPARNEAAMLPQTLLSLLKQDYPGTFHVFVVDDNSDDSTAETADSIAEMEKLSDHLTVTRARPTSDGWSGELWALNEGLNATTGFRARYLLLTDADVLHPVDSMRKLVSHAVDGEFDTVSVISKMSVTTAWEKLLLPAFVYFFAMLFPFQWVNNPGNRKAAAAGGCLLVRRAALEEAGGFRAISHTLIYDCALARAIKSPGGKTWIGFSEEVESLRSYGSPGDIWNMVTRTAYEQLRYSPLILIGTVLALGLLFGGPVFAAVAGAAIVGSQWPPDVLPLTATISGVVAWEIMSSTFAPVLELHGRGRERGLALPFIAALYVLMTLDAARRHHFGGGGSWKGRAARRIQASPIASPEEPSVKQ